MQTRQHPPLPPKQARGQISPHCTSLRGRPRTGGLMRYTQKGRGSGGAWAPCRPLASEILPPDRHHPPLKTVVRLEQWPCKNSQALLTPHCSAALSEACLLPWWTRCRSCFHPPPALMGAARPAVLRLPWHLGNRVDWPSDLVLSAERVAPPRPLNRELSTLSCLQLTGPSFGLRPDWPLVDLGDPSQPTAWGCLGRIR